MRNNPSFQSGNLRLTLQPQPTKGISLLLNTPANTGQLNMQLGAQAFNVQGPRMPDFETKEIILMFYKPSRDDAFQNKLVAFFDGPYCHVEIGFVCSEKLKDDKGDSKGNTHA